VLRGGDARAARAASAVGRATGVGGGPRASSSDGERRGGSDPAAALSGGGGGGHPDPAAAGSIGPSDGLGWARCIFLFFENN